MFGNILRKKFFSLLYFSKNFLLALLFLYINDFKILQILPLLSVLISINIIKNKVKVDNSISDFFLTPYN